MENMYLPTHMLEPLPKRWEFNTNQSIKCAQEKVKHLVGTTTLLLQGSSGNM